MENKTSFDRNFNAVTNVLNASVGQCFDDVGNDKIYLPDFLTHASECSCNYCTNSYLQDFHIRLYLQYIDSRKSFHQSKPLHLSHYKEAIDNLTANADSRFQANLSFVKRLLNYKDEEETREVKKKASKNLKKKVDPDDTASAKEPNRKFSKYVTEARLLGESSIKGTAATSSSSINMVSNVEFLISKLELDGYSLSLDRSSHDFQRLIAQLYYLRSLLYLENKNNNNNTSVTVNKTTKEVSSLAAVDKEAPTVKSVIRKTNGRTINAVHSKATTASAKRKTTIRTNQANNVKDHEEELFDDNGQLPVNELPKRKTTRPRKGRNTKDHGGILSDDGDELQVEKVPKRKPTRSKKEKKIKDPEGLLSDETGELQVDKLPRRKATRSKKEKNIKDPEELLSDEPGELQVDNKLPPKRKPTRQKASYKNIKDKDDIDIKQSSPLLDEPSTRKKTRKRTKKEDTINNKSNPIETDSEQNAQKLSDHIKKLSLKEQSSLSASATTDDNRNEFQPKMNDSFLLDLKKVLGLLNPFTDTLIIKAIYELVAFMTSSPCVSDGVDDRTKLALTTQFLASSRTLHQQVLNSIGKKLRFEH